jgi:hypothetical protein
MWFNPETKQVFTTHSEIRTEFPNVSLPSVMTDASIASVGVLPVTPTTPPAFDRLTQKVVEAQPVLIAGEWIQQWGVIALTTEEQQSAALQLKEEIEAATQKRLDDFASTRNYDSILSACTYATSAVPKFAAEGQYCVEARDATWTKLLSMLAEVEAGTRPVPTGYADIEPDLPVLAWPA